jgi:uncharacterized protein involved in cysteine biosynthesis
LLARVNIKFYRSGVLKKIILLLLFKNIIKANLFKKFILSIYTYIDKYVNLLKDSILFLNYFKIIISMILKLNKFIAFSFWRLNHVIIFTNIILYYEVL